MINIGRKTSGGSIFGNPVAIGRRCPECGKVHTTAGSTLPCYKRYLWRKMQDDEFRKALRALDGQELYCPGCGVNGAHCHGRIMEKAIAYLKTLE